MSSPLSSKYKEAFCQIMATEDVDYGVAAFRAGYGAKKYKQIAHYHYAMGSRLMQDDSIRMRISEIRIDLADKDKAYTINLMSRLKKVVSFNPLKYYGSNTVTLDNGTKVTRGYLRKNLEDWDRYDGELIAGFDRNGLPRMIDKEWAIEKLLKIYALDGSRTVDVEDLLGLFNSAGLPTNNNNDYSMHKTYLEEAETDEEQDIIEQEVEESLKRDSEGDNNLESLLPLLYNCNKDTIKRIKSIIEGKKLSDGVDSDDDIDDYDLYLEDEDTEKSEDEEYDDGVDFFTSEEYNDDIEEA